MVRKVALVTGVGKETGLGFELCRQLLMMDYDVWVAARSVDKAEAMVGALGNGAAHPIAIDITDPASVEAAKVQITALDLLINNAAAMSPWGEAGAEADLEASNAIMQTTLYGTWRMCQAMLPVLRQSAAGRIVNVSSGAGSHGDMAFGLTTDNQMGTSYAVAKVALNALTVKLAREETSPNMRINAVCPGFTATFEGGADMGARPVAEGAKSILWPAMIPNDGPTGGFFRDGQGLPW